MQIDLIENISTAEQLRPEWDDLFGQGGHEATLFVGSPWHECWWRHFAGRVRPSILAVRKAGKLVGVLPLMKQKCSLHGLPVRTLSFIENRNSLHNDFMILPDHREAVLRAAIRFMLARRDRWEALHLRNTPVNSPNHDLFLGLLDEMGLTWVRRPSYSSPYLVPAGSWEELLAGRSQRVRKTLRNIRNSMHKAGAVVVRNIRTWEEFQAVSDAVFAVARKSWTDSIGDSLATPVNRGFFTDLARVAADNGWFSLWTLELNGAIIAFEYHLTAYGKQHALRSSFDPDFAGLSPGTYLEMEILQRLFDDPGEVRIHDFGGSFDAYKKKWTDTSVDHVEIMVFNDRLYSRTLGFYEKEVIERLRTVRDRYRSWRRQSSAQPANPHSS